DDAACWETLCARRRRVGRLRRGDSTKYGSVNGEEASHHRAVRRSCAYRTAHQKNATAPPPPRCSPTRIQVLSYWMRRLFPGLKQSQWGFAICTQLDTGRPFRDCGDADRFE